MRNWHLAGYFEPTLQLMNRAEGPNAQWKTLRDHFPNVADAFLVAPSASQVASPKAGAAATPAEAKARFDFPEWLPVPPRFRGVKKTYPSEKNGATRTQVNITDVNGQQVSNFSHAR